MNCPTARDEMLAAEPAVLAGEGDTALAQHLRACTRCRAAAQVMMQVTADLRAALAADAPSPPVEAALERAARRDRARSRRWWFAAGPALAAAAVASVLLVSHPPAPPAPRATVDLEPQTRGVLVASPPGRNVAIFQTGDPNIVIVWIL